MLSIFRGKIDPQNWYIQFKEYANTAAPELRAVGGYQLRLGTERPREQIFSESEIEELRQIADRLQQIYREFKRTKIPKDAYLDRVRKSFEGVLYGGWRFCEWLAKYATEPSKVRWSNVVAFLVVVTETMEEYQQLVKNPPRI